jgi:hypothetical protein
LTPDGSTKAAGVSFWGYALVFRASVICRFPFQWDDISDAMDSGGGKARWLVDISLLQQR